MEECRWRSADGGVHEYLERACGMWGGTPGVGGVWFADDSDFDKSQGSATSPSRFCSRSGVLLAQRKY
jgi:hypothetical protein